MTRDERGMHKDSQTGRITLIAAVARNGVIGADGDMPWRLSTDLKRFKALTLGKPLIMGRRTFQSIGKPLPGRTNIVVTRDESFSHDGVLVAHTVDDALLAAARAPGGTAEICVIGGGELYRQTIDRAERLCITHVDAAPPGDTLFPLIDPGCWRAISQEVAIAGEQDSAATRFVVYERLTH